MPESCAAYWTLSFPEPEIACLELDTPDSRVNLLGFQVLTELQTILGKRGKGQAFFSICIACE